MILMYAGSYPVGHLSSKIIGKSAMKDQKLTKQVFVRDKGRCVYCKSKVFLRRFCSHKNVKKIVNHDVYSLFWLNGKIRVLPQGTMDHVIPKSQGGDYSLENLVLSCYSCNQRRGKNKYCPYLDDFLKKAENGTLCHCGKFPPKGKKRCDKCRRTSKCDCGNSKKLNKAFCKVCLTKTGIHDESPTL